ncbi:MAG TPA: DUF177 domain-containing protein [Thermodesulfobacteriota bacterium]
MKLRIDEVPTTGVRLRWDEPAESLAVRFASERGGGAGAPVDASALEPIRVDLEVARVERTLAVMGRVETTVGLECARCLAPVQARMALPTALLFVPATPGAAAHEDTPDDLDLSDLPFELPAEGLEVLDYSGSEVDLGQAAVDQVVLAMPLAPLCQESCRGLCPHCGQDLNVAGCGCADDPVDPRFAVLKNLKLSR